MNKGSIKNYSDLLSIKDLERITDDYRESCDDYAFIISHQTSELWFMVVIRELEEYCDKQELLHLDRAYHATVAMNAAWEVLGTLSIEAFEHIRSQLEGTSGMESANYFRALPMIKAAHDCCKDDDHLRRLNEIDSGFAMWRFRHAVLARKLIGDAPGTGGSTGASDLESKIFDFLIDHDKLSGEGDSSAKGKCPF